MTLDPQLPKISVRGLLMQAFLTGWEKSDKSISQDEYLQSAIQVIEMLQVEPESLYAEEGLGLQDGDEVDHLDDLLRADGRWLYYGVEQDNFFLIQWYPDDAAAQAKLAELGLGQNASVSGRYYAMDRDNNWDREEKAYAAFVYGEGPRYADAQQAIEASYAADVTDEFVVPCVTCEGGRVEDGDTVIFMNFRPDRARQMTRIFCDDGFTGFERRGGRKQVHYVCMAEYDATMPNCEVAYPPVELTNVLGEYLSKNGKTQLRIAETEKYAHVTFFFNGGVEAPYPGEDRVVIPSPKDVPTYDLKPQMSAPEVADECKRRIESGKYDVIILNFANCDMVGHTGVYDAAVKAVEAVDAAVKEVVEAVLAAGGCAFLTADHGNAEKMANPDGTPFTAHTTNVVPFVAIGCGDVKLREGGCLADIAPTMLPYVGLPVPAEMTGKSLIEG